MQRRQEENVRGDWRGDWRVCDDKMHRLGAKFKCKNLQERGRSRVSTGIGEKAYP